MIPRTPKNVLLISLDDMVDAVRYREAFGVEFQTPAIDSLMSRGVTFTNAFAAVARCVPSRAAMLSGQSPFATGIHNNEGPQIQDVMTVEETLLGRAHEAGWYTAARGKLFHGQGTDRNVDAYLAPVLDASDATPGHLCWTPFPGPLGDSPVPEEQTFDAITAEWAAAFLRDLPTDDPFFLSVGIVKPHRCWDVPKEYYDLFDRDAIVVPDIAGLVYEDLPDYFRNLLHVEGLGFHDWMQRNDPELWRDLVHAYMAAVSFADAQVGKVLEAMTETGRWEDTTVLLWSDHGYHLGDRDVWHKFTLWEEAAAIPLVVVDPDIGTAGSRVAVPVSTLDIWPTLSGLAGLPPPALADGFDLSPLMADPGATLARQGVITSTYGSLSVRTAEARYNLYTSGEEELFLMGDGGVFQTDVSGYPAYRVLLDRMRQVLRAEAESFGVEIVAQGQTGTGTPDDDIFVILGNARAAGGGGDDSYYQTGSGGILEEEGGGVDTVVIGTNETWQLPVNVENARMVWGASGTLLGNDGDNLLAGSPRNNVMFGLPGDDLIDGTDGDDRLDGGDGADTLIGGKHEDSLYGRAGRDVLQGGVGDDLLDGGSNRDTASYADGGAVTVALGIEGYQNTGAQGTDRLIGIENLLGSDWNDILIGDAAMNRLQGGAGSDSLSGQDGGDTLLGGTGADTLDGQIGDDEARGNAGADVLRGGEGNDTLRGGEHDDTLRGGGGDDLMVGGPGRDLADYSGAGAIRVDLATSSYQPTGTQGRDRLKGLEDVRGSDGADVIKGDDGANRLMGRLGADALSGRPGADSLTGGGGADTLLGQAGGDSLAGNGGADELRGGRGDDTLDGGKQRDALRGGAGADVLVGGSGQDVYLFSVGDGRDTIADFDPALDRIAFLDGPADRDALALRVDGDDVVIRYATGDAIRLFDTDPEGFDAWHLVFPA